MSTIRSPSPTADLTASTIHRPRNNVWVDDSLVTLCHQCDRPFGFWVRRHHCRCCGNIFCHGCSNNQVQIPEYIDDRPTAEDYWNLGYYTSVWRGPEERVCDSCREMISARKRAQVALAALLQHPPSIRGLREDPLCTETIRDQYLNALRHIQYQLPDAPYTTVQRRLLQANQGLFAGHSKYTVHALKTLDWGSLTAESVALRLLTGRPLATCTELWCTRTCQATLSCDDCLHVLCTVADSLPGSVIEHLLAGIRQSPEPVLLCHVSLLVRLLCETHHRHLHRGLVEICQQTRTLTYQTYWALQIRVGASEPPPPGASHYYSRADPHLLAEMGRGYAFYAGLIEALPDPREYLSERLPEVVPLPLPYAPETRIVSVLLDSYTVKDSYTRPVCLTFLTEEGEEIGLLWKREDISNDITVLNLMTLCNIILEDYLQRDFPVIAYPAMQLSPTGGVIEIVRGASTVYSITREGKSILQHIVLRNGHRTVADVLQRYMRSLVVYTLHNYFIGLGDRHLQNIMLTDDGVIFHIDFGYILGEEAHLAGAEVKINADMIETMGGTDTELYADYLRLCGEGTTVLRKHYVLFYLLLAETGDRNQVARFINSRFQPRQTDRAVAESLVSVIRQSSEGYGGYIIDFLHYHTQEKTVQTGLSRVVQQALGAVGYLGGRSAE